MAETETSEPPADDGVGNSVAPEEARASRRRSRLVGDVPDQIGDRYFVEERGLRREQRLFENPHDASPTIRDLGHRLIAVGESAAVVRDLVDIARHRGWEVLDVSGSDRFRRMIEQEARQKGLEISRPMAPDRRLPADRAATTPGRAKDRAHAPGDFRVGVAGIVVEMGEAPFNGRPGQRPSPYVDLQLADGRVRRAWGRGFRRRLRASGSSSARRSCCARRAPSAARAVSACASAG